MDPFSPQVLTSEEIRSLLTEVTPQEFERTRGHSLTRLKPHIFYEGSPGTALVRDTGGEA
jgi:hypothetical protein